MCKATKITYSCGCELAKVNICDSNTEVGEGFWMNCPSLSVSEEALDKKCQVCTLSKQAKRYGGWCGFWRKKGV
ncbi:hypothetical protein NA56DRAFT_643230 [Hyaloscypha hepaticicola]|uniref:Uncharacterized protein n=1 Tax=Hyaloscypha hepaticicola TaxID=2082293 RepID=A0A2J6QEP3_9HELO|nr:hypothetical protein NA56DRAFT_643230 [Hyaloscypha hepaticicola]